MNNNDEIKNNSTDESCTSEVLNNNLNQCKDQLKELTDKYMVLAADFQNYRSRMIKERSEWAQQAHTEVLKNLLPIIDDFERALHHDTSSQSDQTGLIFIYRTLQKLLAQYDVTVITDIAHFDPEKHDAVVQVDAPEKTSGSIVAILENGYQCKGRTLRPAKVSVAR